MLYNLYINGNLHSGLGADKFNLFAMADKTTQPATVTDENGNILFENDAQAILNNSNDMRVSDLIHYGKILTDEEFTANNAFHRTRLFLYDGELFVLKMTNGFVTDLFKI